jgi:DNA (cytosine-5)-methyltransferase 1
MKHISLFSGIGGFDLAAEWMGWQNIASCEINPFSRRHLEFYWPDAYHHDDIHTLTFDLLNEKISKKYPDWQSDDIILTGGFPCQPYSQAGKRLGKEDERHLWPEMLRVIREVRPRYIVGENVSGIVNWSDGLVFEEVQVDLENEGYEVQAFILPAAAVDAPHRRDRVWFIANRYDSRTESFGQVRQNKIYGLDTSSNTNSNGQQRSNGKHEINASERRKYAQRYIEQGVKHGIITNANDQRLQRGAVNGGISGSGTKRNKHSAGLFCTTWQNFPTQSPVCIRNDGIPARLDGITFPKWRNESIKAAGNAIVPQVALKIFQAIEQINNQTT